MVPALVTGGRECLQLRHFAAVMCAANSAVVFTIDHGLDYARRVSVNYILFECEDFGPLSAKAAQFAILDCVAPLISHQ